MDIATLQDQYMSYMGGQNKVYCRTHDLPLIVALFKSGQSCSCMRDKTGDACIACAAFECPVDGCGVCARNG